MDPQKRAEIVRELQHIARELEIQLYSPCVEPDPERIEKLRKEQRSLETVLRGDVPDILP